MSSMKENVVLGTCPICSAPTRAIDSTYDVPNHLRKCDENEFYKCYYDKDNKSLHYLARQKEGRVINWEETEGGQLG